MKAIQLFEGDMIITTAQQQAAQQGQDLRSLKTLSLAWRDRALCNRTAAK